MSNYYFSNAGFGIIVVNGRLKKLPCLIGENYNEMRLYSHDNLAVQFNATEILTK